MALLAGSPALGEGDGSNGVLVDQRGAALRRGQLGLSDIGALRGQLRVPGDNHPGHVGRRSPPVDHYAGQREHQPGRSSTAHELYPVRHQRQRSRRPAIDLSMVSDATVGPSAAWRSTGAVEIDGPVACPGGGVTILGGRQRARKMRLFSVATAATPDPRRPDAHRRRGAGHRRRGEGRCRRRRVQLRHSDAVGLHVSRPARSAGNQVG